MGIDFIVLVLSFHDIASEVRQHFWTDSQERRHFGYGRLYSLTGRMQGNGIYMTASHEEIPRKCLNTRHLGA
jgi:hypothetical protein